MKTSAGPNRILPSAQPLIMGKASGFRAQLACAAVETSAAKARVLLADNHPLVAHAVSRLLAVEFDIVGIASNGRRLLTDAALLKPDLIVLDIDLPELNGVEAARHLAKLVPASKLVFLTHQVTLPDLRAVLAVGGLGYVARQSASGELVTALRMALRGRHYLSSQLKSASPSSRSRSNPLPAQWLAPDHLTLRQRQVLQMVAEGQTTRQISAALQISPKTVEFHRAALMNHTGLRTTAELTRYAVAAGLVAPSPLQETGY